MSNSRTLNVKDRSSSSDENVYDHKLMFPVRVDVTVHDTWRYMYEVAPSRLNSISSFQAVFEPDSARYHEGVKMPRSMVVPTRHRPACNSCS